ncbi:MAG: peroxide stress protein YaaA [Flavobacteriales bacterium]|nr:peroxide stress protein YaaA [Flavobacteriales bacterium]|tara:strand:+ start:1948 stop:2721 length:774 start_codon:yes stop_codon:yes gene_type:complete
MISIVSPAKSLNFDDSCSVKMYSQCSFLKDSQLLVNDLKKYSQKQISDLMKVSDKIGLLNADRYKNWSLPFNEGNSKQAVFAFQGDVYQGLEIDSFSEDDLIYAQDYFRILSGLYGLLKPLDLIQPYRLEMGTSFKNKRGKNLYDFWNTRITELLNKELELSKSQYLLNLASNEYYKVIQPNGLNATVITPIFKDFKNGQYKIISFFAKRARGMMASFHLKNKINNPEDLKSFNMAGYTFNDDMSNDNQLVFTRRQD